MLPRVFVSSERLLVVAALEAAGIAEQWEQIQEGDKWGGAKTIQGNPRCFPVVYRRISFS